MANKYPSPQVVISRLATLTGIPLAGGPLNLPVNPHLRAMWDGERGCYVSEVTERPVTCLTLHRSANGIAAHLHVRGASGADEFMFAPTPAEFARAVWAFEAGQRLVSTAMMADTETTPA